MTKAKRGEPLRFLHDVIENSRGPGPCIEWPYAVTSRGYPWVSVGGHPWQATRYVLMAIDGGPDKAKLQAAHQPQICHSRICVRPSHLRWATHSENMRDKNLDGTAGLRVLTTDLVLEIRSRYSAGGITQVQLGLEYGVQSATIADVVAFRTHREIAS